MQRSPGTASTRRLDRFSTVAHVGPTVPTEPLSSFGLAVHYDEGRPVLQVTGEVDICTAPELEGVIDGIVGRLHGDLVLDLRELAFMDASGLGVIIRSAMALDGSGGRLTLRAPNALTIRLLGLVELGDNVVVELDDDVGVITEAALGLADREVVRTALLLVVALAEAAVSGADAVTMSLAPHGPLADVVAIDPDIAALDRDQYAVGEGPCLDAAEQVHRFEVTSMTREQRWPAFVPRAREHGVNSILSTPLRREGGALGALNMYSFRDDAFTDADQATAELLAHGAASVIDRGSFSSSASLEARVRDAVASRREITLAQGILVGRERLTADGAFAALRRESKRTSRPLRDVAAAITATAEGGAGHDPHPA